MTAEKELREKTNPAQTKYVPTKEFIIFLACAFLYTNMEGMAGGFRQKYLVDILGLASTSVASINLICAIVSFALGFLFTMVIDRAPKQGKDKFRPLVLMAAIPSGIFSVLMFWTPGFISELAVVLMIAYQCTVTILYNASKSFASTVNQFAVVMTPDMTERDKMLSFRGISSAIGNSAPLVVVMVIGLLEKPGIIKSEAMTYLISAITCAVASSAILIVGARTIKERVVYSPKKVNPLLGYKDILKNKYAWLVLLSEFIKNFRGIATYMGVFLAAALLGSSSKFLLFGLPTGIGTMVGMLIVQALLKKFNSKQIYIASGIYSVIANLGAFAVGAYAFQHPETIYQVIFFVFLFLIGLQYGASNLLPNMFKADILEDLEAKTGKRLEASLDFAIGIGGQISGAIAGALAPMVLYGSSALNFIQYVQQVGDEVVSQSETTKIRLLLVYTMGQGIFMLLCGVPFWFYRLTGKRKEQVHETVMANRAMIAEGDAAAGNESA